MNQATRRPDAATRSYSYFEFATNQIDWGTVPAADIEAGLTELCECGSLIRIKRGTYRTVGQYGEENESARSLSPAGVAVKLRLKKELFDQVPDGPPSQEAVDLLRRFLDGDPAKVAEALGINPVLGKLSKPTTH